ncbi:MAG: glycosyltransferase [Deltaproteobacteria bacterium]|nr:glycosyltransferase [Deltaproteobacteria bacterium]
MISVLLPARDPDARHLRYALRSTLRSRGVDVDVVVVDHGSAVPIVVDDARVRVLRVDGALPFSAALELGRAAIRAPFFARMDSDDVMHPLRLAEDLAFLRAHPVAAVSSRVKILPKSTTYMHGYAGWQNSILSPSDHQREMWIEQPICNPATTYRNAAVDVVGGYRPMPWPEDYDLFLRLVCAGFTVEKKPLVRHGWRQHGSQVTRTKPWQTRDALALCKAAHLVPAFHLRERAVWILGTGKEGRRISRALRAEGVAAAGFVDVDPKKIGKTVHGVVVVGAAGLPAGAFVIGAVGTSGARGVVRELLRDRGYVEGVDAVVVC